MGFGTSNRPSRVVFPHGRKEEAIGGVYDVIVKVRQKIVSILDGKQEVPILKDIKLGGWLLSTPIAGYFTWNAAASILSIWWGMGAYIVCSPLLIGVMVIYNMVLKPWLGSLRATLVIFAPWLIVYVYLGGDDSLSVFTGLTGVIGAFLWAGAFLGPLIGIDIAVRASGWKREYMELLLFLPALVLGVVTLVYAALWPSLLLPSLILTMWSGWWFVGPKGGFYNT